MSNQIKVVSSKNAPKAIGPYSHAKIFGSLVFISGQVALDPTTNTIVQGGIQPETHQVMKNLQAILTDSGSSLQHVLKCTIYLLDMNDFAKVNQIYGSYFKSAFPARVTIAVKQLPKQARVQIDAIGVVSQIHHEAEIINQAQIKSNQTENVVQTNEIPIVEAEQPVQQPEDKPAQTPNVNNQSEIKPQVKEEIKQVTPQKEVQSKKEKRGKAKKEVQKVPEVKELPKRQTRGKSTKEVEKQPETKDKIKKKVKKA